MLLLLLFLNVSFCYINEVWVILHTYLKDIILVALIHFITVFYFQSISLDYYNHSRMKILGWASRSSLSLGLICSAQPNTWRALSSPEETYSLMLYSWRPASWIPHSLNSIVQISWIIQNLLLYSTLS